MHIYIYTYIHIYFIPPFPSNIKSVSSFTCIPLSPIITDSGSNPCFWEVQSKTVFIASLPESDIAKDTPNDNDDDDVYLEY
jgi:hypothetical protein